VTLPQLTSAYACDEREISPVDEEGGIARRWCVTRPPTLDAETGVMLPAVSRLVVLTRTDGGRWASQPALLCSCGVERCVHLARVREEIFHSRPPEAA
jgi:hypothetical protein